MGRRRKTVPGEYVKSAESGFFLYGKRLERFDAAFAVDHQRQPVAVLTGEIEKRTVLTELVGVVREVVGAVVVAGDENDAATDELAQAAAGGCTKGKGKERELKPRGISGVF